MVLLVLALLAGQIFLGVTSYYVHVQSVRLEKFVAEMFRDFDVRLLSLKSDVVNAGGSFGETRMKNELRTVVSALTGGITKHSDEVSFMKEQIKEFRSEIDRIQRQIQFSSSGVEKPNGVDSSPTIF